MEEVPRNVVEAIAKMLGESGINELLGLTGKETPEIFFDRSYQFCKKRKVRITANSDGTYSLVPCKYWEKDETGEWSFR